MRFPRGFMAPEGFGAYRHGISGCERPCPNRASGLLEIRDDVLYRPRILGIRYNALYSARYEFRSLCQFRCVKGVADQCGGGREHPCGPPQPPDADLCPAGGFPGRGEDVPCRPPRPAGYHERARTAARADLPRLPVETHRRDGPHDAAADGTCGRHLLRGRPVMYLHGRRSGQEGDPSDPGCRHRGAAAGGTEFGRHGRVQRLLGFDAAAPAEGGRDGGGYLVIGGDAGAHGGPCPNRDIILYRPEGGRRDYNGVGAMRLRARVAELAKDVGLKIRSLAVRGFESPLSHHHLLALMTLR